MNRDNYNTWTIQKNDKAILAIVTNFILFDSTIDTQLFEWFAQIAAIIAIVYVWITIVTKSYYYFYNLTEGKMIHNYPARNSKSQTIEINEALPYLIVHQDEDEPAWSHSKDVVIVWWLMQDHWLAID